MTGAGAGSIAVLGAGWLGSAFAVQAAARGWRVRAATRSGRWRRPEPPPPGVESRTLDVLRDREDAVAELLTGVDAAVACWAPGRDQERRALYVEGATKVARACRGAAIRRLVWASSTSALADVDGWVDEDSEDWPAAPRGRIQREAEEAIRGELEGSDVACTILRFAGLYGPGRELARIYRVHDDAVRAGDGLEATNLIHLDDAVAALLASVERPTPASGIFHVCDDDHRTRREVAQAVAAAMGGPAPQWEVSPAGPAPRGKRVANRKLKEVLGVDLRHPAHEI